MSGQSKIYQSNHQVFGELEVMLKIEGSDSKNNKSSLTIKNVSGCYPFIIRTSSRVTMEIDEVEIELGGGGEETSLLECLVDIVDKLQKDGWASHRDIKDHAG